MIESPVVQQPGRTPVDGTAHTVVASPLGDLTLVRHADELVGIHFRDRRLTQGRLASGEASSKGFEACWAQLGEYFAGTRCDFDLLHRTLGNEHDRRVWALAATIPYGKTITYGWLARELADGTTPQEVGAALGRNPLCILVPCHRVIGADGRLTGYAGGLERKRFLLDLEQRVAGHPGRLF